MRGTELARKLPDRYCLSFTLGLGAHLHRSRGEVHETLACAKEGISVSEEQGVAQFGAWSNIVAGWAEAANGNLEDGLRQATEGFKAWCSLGLIHVQWRHQILLADIHRMSGNVERALGLIEDAEKLDSTKHRGLGLADLHIMKGDLLIKASRFAEGEACLNKAYNMAHAQNAKLFELRAVTRLARLQRDKAQHAKSRELLIATYNRYTEGFDTRDLKEAAALISELQ